jgi:hypothetical protein
MTFDRRQFVKLTVVLTGVTVTGGLGALASACSSDTTPSGPTVDAGNKKDTGTPTPGPDGGGSDAGDSGGGTLQCKESISQNHSHAITIPIADLDSTSTKIYSIKGTSTHSHNITLEAQDLADLKAGLSVTKTSDMNGETHDHEVALLCTKL